MTEFYDRTEEGIKQDLEKTYNQIDGAFGNGRRDDRDVLEAAKVVLKKYMLEDLEGYEGGRRPSNGNGESILEVVDDQGNPIDYDEKIKKAKQSMGWVVEEYENLEEELNKNIQDLEGTNHYIWTSISPHIQRLAGRINSAEEKVLINRRLYQSKKDLYELIGKDRIFIDPPYFGSSEVNGKPILEVLQDSGIKNHPENVYYLDYSKCSDNEGDPQIKKDILEKTGNYIIAFKYDEKTKNLNFYDIQGNIIDLKPTARKGIQFGMKGNKEYIEGNNLISEAPALSWTVNGKTIEEVFGENITKSNNTSFTLDYRDCKNNELIAEVINLKPDLIIDLNYNKETGTWYFVNDNNEKVNRDIKMWEGIRITSHEYNRFLEIHNSNRQLTNAKDKFSPDGHPRYSELLDEIRMLEGDSDLDKLKTSKKYKKIFDQLNEIVPNWKKSLTDYEAANLIISIESRLDEVVYKNKKYGFDINGGEPISRDGSMHLQANFIGGSNEVREVLFTLKDIEREGQTIQLNRNEYYKLSDPKMKDFLAMRLKEKREGGLFDQYELTESFIVQGETIDTDNEQEIEKFELKTRSLSQLLSGCEDFKREYEEGGDSQPPELYALSREIKKYLKTLETDFSNHKSWTNNERNKVRDNLRTLFLNFKNNDGNRASMTDKTAKQYFYDIFSGKNKADIDLAVKSLCNGLTFLDNTTAQVDPNEYKENLSIKDENNTNYDFCRKNITKKLSIDINPKDGDEGKEFELLPPENKILIDNLISKTRELGSLKGEEKVTKFIEYLQKPLEFLPGYVDKEDEELRNSVESILGGLENKIKFLDSKKREISPKQYKEKLKERERELRGKELNDEELMEIRGIQAILEMNDKELQELYINDINESAKISLTYGGMDELFDGQLAKRLIKKGGGVKVENGNQEIANQINDSFGLRGWWDWSDETCKAAAPFLQDLLIEVAITATAIALGAVTAGAGTAAIASLRATARATKAAKVASLASKAKKFGKIAKFAKTIGTGTRKITRIGSKIKETKCVKTMLNLTKGAKTSIAGSVERTASSRVGRMLYRNTEWIRQTSFWNKGESIGKMIARGNALRHTSGGYQFAGFLIEGVGFHVSSTAIHNAINGQNIMEGLNPFGTTEITDPETGEKISISNARGYAESIAFLGVLKAIGAPIQNITTNTLGKLLETPLTEGIFKKTITNCVSVGGEMASLGVTEQFLNQVFEGEWKKMTTEDFIRSLGMVIGLRGTRLMGKGKKWLIKEYDKAKQELTLDIGEGTIRVDAEGNIIISTTDIGKPGENLYFEGKESKLGIKEGQARGNSSFVDNVLENINEGNQREQLDKLKNEIIKQYEEVTGKKIELTDEQILSIIKAHLQEGELGKLKRKELSKKAKTLAETIKDPEIRRFLLEAGFCGEQISYTEHIEKSYKEFLEKNSSLKERVERGDFEFLGKKIEDLYKEFLNKTLEGKGTAEQESLTFDFNTRFQSSLEFVSGKFDKIKFLYEGKLIEGTITKYGESLLGKDFESSPTKKAFFDKLKSSMFYQHLDNPLKFCSHGADHSILVDKYVQNIIEKNSDVVKSVIEKYGVDEIGAIQLLRLTAVFHDFGYPDIGKLAKSMHGPFGGVHFINEYASPKNATFVEYIKQNLGIKDPAKIDQLIKDMRDAIFFHSADKVEKGYLNKITYKKGSFLLGNDFTAEGTDEFIEILTRESDGSMTITYRSEAGKENAEAFVAKLKEKYPKLDERKIKIETDNNSYDYDVEFDYEYESDGKTIKRDENGKPIRKYEYHGRKGKTGDSGIEFQPIDLLSDPLAGIVRLADNMDMSFDRLTPIQRHPIFMNLLYNLGYEHGNPGSASHIFKKMEKLNKLDKKKQVSQEEYDKKSKKEKDDYITPEEYRKQYDEISTEIKKLIEEANKSGGIEITIFDETTGKPKEKFKVQFDENKVLNQTGKVDLYTYKSSIIKEIAKKQGYSGDPNVDIIQNISKDDDIGSYSFRHFVGLTPIRDVTIEGGNLVVKVDKNIYLDPNLWSQKLTEKGGFNERPVVEYHIRRLFDASGRVTVGKTDGRTGLLNLTIIDGEGNIIGTASRNTAQEKFDIKYKVQTPDIDEQY